MNITTARAGSRSFLARLWVALAACLLLTVAQPSGAHAATIDVTASADVVQPTSSKPGTASLTFTNNTDAAVVVDHVDLRTGSAWSSACYQVTVPAHGTATCGTSVGPGTQNTIGYMNAAVVAGGTTYTIPVDMKEPAPDQPPAAVHIIASLTAAPATVPADGGDVTFTADVTNVSSVGLTLTSLKDSAGKDLSTYPGTCKTSVVIDVDATYSCTYTRHLSGVAGQQMKESVTAEAVSSTGVTADDTNYASVTFGPAAGGNSTPTVTATPAHDHMSTDGGAQDFTVTVTNTSSQQATLSEVTFAAADGGYIRNWNDCGSPLLDPGASVKCTIHTNLSANTGDVTYAVGVKLTAADGTVITGRAAPVVHFDIALPNVTAVATGTQPTSTQPGKATITFTNNTDAPVTVVKVDVQTATAWSETCQNQVIPAHGTITCGAIAQPNMTFSQLVATITDAAGVTHTLPVKDEITTPQQPPVTRDAAYWQSNTTWPGTSSKVDRKKSVAITSTAKVTDVFAVPSSCKKAIGKATLHDALAYADGTSMCDRARMIIRDTVVAVLNKAADNVAEGKDPVACTTTQVADANSRLRKP